MHLQCKHRMLLKIIWILQKPCIVSLLTYIRPKIITNRAKCIEKSMVFFLLWLQSFVNLLRFTFLFVCLFVSRFDQRMPQLPFFFYAYMWCFLSSPIIMKLKCTWCSLSYSPLTDVSPVQLAVPCTGVAICEWRGNNFCKKSIRQVWDFKF